MNIYKGFLTSLIIIEITEIEIDSTIYSLFTIHAHYSSTRPFNA